MTRVVILVALLCGLCAPRAARASCGFYATTSGQPAFDDATHVVLMRVGTRTVVSLQPHYRGPAEAFALVVPVPAGVQERDVRVLAPDVLDVVERIGAPRLVEYWERDPCAPETDAVPSEAAAKPAREDSQDTTRDADDGTKPAAEVRVDARFAAGEYRISIVAASDAAAFDAWLRAEKYQLPASAEPLLAPYLARGMKLLVARVDPAKVRFDGDRALLSPLRFHYDSERFELPIRIGLASSDGTQDLIVDVLAPHQRYRVANEPNVTIPTNVTVDRSVRVQFAAFYNALFDATLEQHPDAVITEYAWAATTCDPCPGPALDRADFDALGADVVDRTAATEDFVLTRLHLRYGKDVTEDLELVPAPPIAGGREHVSASGLLDQDAQPASHDSFQARYAIRHPWLGPLRCANPVRERWGAQDGGEAEFPAPPRRGRGALYRLPRSDLQPALGLAFAPRDAVVLAHALAQDVPAVDVSVADHGEMLAPAVPAST
ncbi:MAG TPA: DUF2330 domain-containing protein, partial [Kofleriaceae bacterium]|nr:DUF2330 domain-containing protein [Kofleriaceae bacterium]